MMNFSKSFDINWPRILDLNKNSTIVFRVDSSALIGAGHLMRCLTLAEELRGDCQEIIFICCELPGNMTEQVKTRGFQIFGLPLGPDIDQWQIDARLTKDILVQHNLEPDWLVVDHYGLDKRWESALRTMVKRIMCIDDLADREHDCDLMLDQNYHKNMKFRYKGLVPENSRQLLGPQYALLRREFKAVRQTLRERDGSVKRILVFYGGSDPTKETTKALEAIKIVNRPDIAVDVVVGVSNPKREQLKEICSRMINTSFYCQVENMAELMAKADLALGAGGTATWERCYLGLPTIVTVVAENQRETVEDLAEVGVVWSLGWHKEVDAEDLAQAVKDFIVNPNSLLEMTRREFAFLEVLLER